MLIQGLLKSILREARIGLVDVGASGGLEGRWRPYAPYIAPMFFEPDDRGLARLASAGASPNARVFPVALTESDGSVTLYLCAKQMVSSVFKPNLRYLGRFPDVERFRIVGQVDVPARALDSCLPEGERAAVDFLKLDAQGCELRVVEGAKQTLATPVIGLEIEVEFQELYEQQPLFGQVCSAMSTQGFELFDFTNICRWNRNSPSRFGQLAFADALFLRSPESFLAILSNSSERVRREKCLKYIAICAIYDKIDLLTVAVEIFSPCLGAQDVKAIRRWTRLLRARRYVLSKILGVLFRLVFRPLGLNFLAYSYSVPS